MAMLVIKRYSFRNASQILEKERSTELSEVLEAIRRAGLERCREPGGSLLSPKKMASEILGYLHSHGWSKPKISLGEPDNFIEGDALKDGVGVDIQFGKYSFLGWDSFRKMALFGKQGVYRFGIEIAPMASLRRKMSKGVGSFEQVAEKLERAGNPDLGIPVLVLGIDG